MAEISIGQIRIVVHTRSTLRRLSELLYSDGVITRDASKNSDFGLNQYVWRGEQ